MISRMLWPVSESQECMMTLIYDDRYVLKLSVAVQHLVEITRSQFCIAVQFLIDTRERGAGRGADLVAHIID